MRKSIAFLVLLSALCGGALAGDLVPNRMAVSEIGEWVSFNLPDGYTQKHTVVKREGEGAEAQVTIRVENIYDGEVVDTNYVTEVAGDPETSLPTPEDPGTTLATRKATFSLDGRDFDGIAIDVTKDGKPHQVWYVASDIPVYGVGKRTNADGSLSFEIADFGSD